MKNCIIDLITTEVTIEKDQIIVSIIGAEDFEAAVYCFIDGQKEDVIWYSKNHRIHIPQTKYEKNSNFQAQVFLRFDKDDTEVKSVKSAVVSLTAQPEESVQLLADSLLTKLSSIRHNSRFLRSDNPLYSCEDRDLKINAYAIFFEKLHTLEITDTELFNFSIIDGFCLLCNSSYGWKGEHSSLGIPPVAWYEKLECDLDFHFASGSLKHHVYSVIKGIIASVLEEWDIAEKFLSNAKYPLSEHMGHFLRGSATFRHPIRALRKNRSPVEYWNVLDIKKSDLPLIKHSYSENVFVFSAEPNYFNKFSLQVVKSTLDQSLEVDFFFFIIGNESECSATQAEVDALCEKHSRKCYYVFAATKFELLPVAATARFIAAYELLRKTNCQAFIFDIDMTVTTAMADDIRALAESKELALSLKTDGARSFPWTNIAAAGTFYPQSAPALFFAKSVCDYFVTTISYEDNNWWIDQNALFAAYKQLKSVYYSHPVINMHVTTGKGLTQNSDADLLKWKREVKKTGKL